MSGPDIFLSYNREDADRAKHFAEGFAAAGFDVWWDVALRSGEAYDEVTEAALRGARAVVVLWSPRSVVSRWVRAEATLAERKKTLMPAMIEPCERPIMFELTQTADLSNWHGDTADKGWRDFVSHVRDFVGKEAPARPAGTKRDEPLPALDQVSIVVLPFANMSHDPEQEYFADGISEDIITDLSKVSALRVISRNSAFVFKGRNVDATDVARQLNVSHVLEGSVRKSGNRVRVTAQLIDGSTNDHVWAERYDRDLTDIFDLQDELTQAIVAALKLKLLPEEKTAIEDRGTDSPEAYDLFLKSQAALAQRNIAGIDQSIAFGQAAVAIDPAFARAWLRLGTAYVNRAIHAPVTAKESMAQADAAMEQALRSAPDSLMVQQARAAQLHMRRDWIGADQTMAQTKTEGAGGGFFLLSVGRIAEAIEVYREIIRSDPLTINEMFQFAFDSAGRHDEAQTEIERTRKLDTDPALGEYFRLLRLMALGDRDAIEAQFERYLALGHNYMPIHAELFALVDQPEAALAVVRKAFDEPFYQDASHMSGIAQMAAYFGDDALALHALRLALVDMRGVTVVVIWHPLFARVRRAEGFKTLVRDLGLYDYWRTTGHWADCVRPLGDDDFEIIA
jgi:adenylate cyclase